MTTRAIYCCGCSKYVMARETEGKEIYPRRPDLHALPFWICDACGNYVGCHHKTQERTRPLGNIPTKEIREARKAIHAILDPVWKTGRLNRKALYAKLSTLIGRQYHTAEIRTIEEAKIIQELLKEIVA